MFFNELQRGLFSRTFLVAFLIAILTLFYGFNDYGLWERYAGPSFQYNTFEAFMWALDYGVFLGIAPLIAVLPFSASYLEEGLSGYGQYVLVRKRYAAYLRTKVIINFLVGALAIFMPLLITYAFAHIFYVRELAPPERLFESRYRPATLFSALYWEAPDLYILCRIGLAVLFGGTYAIFGFAISLFTQKPYVVLLTPFVLYHLINGITQIFRIPTYSPITTLSPEFSTYSTYFSVLGQLGFIFALSMITIIIVANKERFVLQQEDE